MTHLADKIHDFRIDFVCSAGESLHSIYRVSGWVMKTDFTLWIGLCRLSDPALGGDRGVAICHETVPDSIGDPPISPSTPMRPIPGVPKLEK